MSERSSATCLAVALSLALALACDTPAAASGAGAALSYHIVEQRLADAARALGAIYAMPVVVDPAIDIVLRDRTIGGDMTLAMADLGKEFGLFVYSDGARYHVLRPQSVESRFARLGSLDASEARQLIAAALPVVPEGAVEILADLGTLVLRGPPDFIAAAENAIKDLQPRRDIEVIGFGRIKK